MRRFAAVFVVVGLLVSLGVLSAPPAFACSCIGGADEEKFSRADAVFVGSVTFRHTEEGVELWSFAVDGVYKGAVFSEQPVVTHASGATCGLELTGAGPFLMFTSGRPQGPGVPDRGDGMLYASLCGGSREVAPDGIPAAFGDPEPPIGSPAAVTIETGTKPAVPLAAVGMLALLVLAVVVLLRGRKPHSVEPPGDT
ncbi:MAG TPA: hypothetical protein VF230_04950 [Acidimicrobiales bacterium]